jgi:hypothetical protein
MIRVNPLRRGARLPTAMAAMALGAALVLPGPATAEAPWEYQVHLLTVGPGRSPAARTGDALLAVARVQPGRVENVVYHFGEPEPDQEGCPFTLWGGGAPVRVVRLGTVTRALSRYAAENRPVWAQRLRLTEGQIQALRSEIAAQLEPARRTHRYHPVRGNSATRIRDVLDKITGGALRRQLLGQRTSATLRFALAEALSGCPGAEILLDLGGGRGLDQPLDLYQGLHAALVLRDELTRVTVPGSGGARVALADRPQVVNARKGAPEGIARWGAASSVLGVAMAIAVVALGLLACLRGPRWLGLWLALCPGVLGLVGLAMLVCSWTSSVPEARLNELLLSFPPTDVWLFLAAGGKRRARWGPVLWGYAWVRVGLAGLVLLGHATGILCQQPRVLLLPGVFCALGLLLLSRASRRDEKGPPLRSHAPREPSVDAGKPSNEATLARP